MRVLTVTKIGAKAGAMTGAIACVLAAGAAFAAGVPMETAVVGKSAVTLYLHDFLTDEEKATLRLVLSNEQALAIFVPENKGFAAMAASPDDGFIRNGKPVASAVALAGLPDAATAETEALKACEAAKTGRAPCVTVLQITPGK